MAWIDLLKLDGAGFAWLVDVSFDDFATVAYRWGTSSVHVGSDHYRGRICEGGLSKLTRGFGNENTVQAGMLSLLLNNTDLGVDWLMDRATVASQVFRARFRVKLLLYEVGNVAANQATKTLGTFKCIDFPSRDSANVSLQLSDDTMGFFNEPLVSPTLRDWKDDAGSDVDNCPLHASYGPQPAREWDVPLPLAFGDGRLDCFAADWDHGNDGTDGTPVGDMDGCRAIPVCVTTSTDAVTSDDVQYLWGVYGADVMLGTQKWAEGAGTTIFIPKQYTVPADSTIGVPGDTNTIWEPQKTQTISKDGVDWKLLWVKFNISAYQTWFQLTRNIVVGGAQPNGDIAPTANLVPEAPVAAATDYGKAFAAFAYFQAQGFPFSARTVDSQAQQLAPNVVKDLISYYSKGSSSDIDSTRFATALQMAPLAVSGVVLPHKPLESRFRYSNQPPPSDAITSGQLRQALVDICQSADLDLAMTWDGKLALYSSYFSFADLTATRVSIRETRCAQVQERVPSKGQRWAPYNRVYAVSPDGVPHGPFDNPDATIDWGATLERVLQGKWLQPFQAVNPLYSSTIWYSERRLESVVRPVIRFITDREGLQLDLGDLFNFTWSRGGSSGPYGSGAVFRVESISVDPKSLFVGIEAVWVDDLTTVNPYLIDDEILALRVQSSGGRTATVVDSDATVTFSSGDLVANGVVAKDVLVLGDSTQAINVFTRYRCIRILSVTDATHLELDTADLDFDAGAGVAVADWKILRGKQTYHTAVSDPVNYPSGSAMYGKAASDSDVYGDATAANVLL